MENNSRYLKKQSNNCEFDKTLADETQIMTISKDEIDLSVEKLVIENKLKIRP